MDPDKKPEQLTHQPSLAEGTVSPPNAETCLELNQALIHNAIERIGMGRYQWQLMVSCGFGFIADQASRFNFNSLIMPQASKEFGPRYATLLSATQYAGLGIGAVFFGLIADHIGRRPAWQTSIFGLAIFTAICASSPNWAALNVFVAISAFFGGGNLAIDLTVLAECLPRKWGFLLTALACLWGLGNAITGLIAWPLVVNFCCPTDATPDTCKKADNMGWRYLYIILGGLCLIMSLLRMLILGMNESPKWLVSRGKLDQAVNSVNAISQTNNSTYTMTIDDLHRNDTEDSSQGGQSRRPTNLSIMRSLFHGRTQLRSMACLIALWLLIGIA
ncbi:hypothetical protein FE257_003116 [Aspergillus nanangensis]|uniref:Major facilitator superfamily (MFS) profile domain-containing protein n=1 Tax=Aspergillus nanangensis TaxID=2582783 RepID=A0AAD4CBW1_ASPNN|nr:hypothetical protein FE257_003116 [Aspergillus nanangensis]